MKKHGHGVVYRGVEYVALDADRKPQSSCPASSLDPNEGFPRDNNTGNNDDWCNR